MKLNPLLLVFLYLSVFSCKKDREGCVDQQPPLFKIGLVADPQYADMDDDGVRFHRNSIEKLKEAIATFNEEKVDFVQNFGDIIQIDFISYENIMPIYDELDLGIENYHLLGNHEFYIEDDECQYVPDLLSMSDLYYTYKKGEFRFIVLDASDYAYYSNCLHQRDIEDIDVYFNATAGQPNHFIWNSAIGEEQQEWLKEELEKASQLNEKVIIFSHVPIRPLGNVHNLWNDEEIISIVEESDNVLAYINGHNHSGNYIFKNGVHYLTLNGMIKTTENAFGIMEVYQNQLKVIGYGNQPDYILEF